MGIPAWAVIFLAVLVAAPLPILLAQSLPARPGAPGAVALDPARSLDLRATPPNLYNSSLASRVPDVSTAYDPQTGTVIAVAENLTMAGTFFQSLETWSYDAGRWTELSPSSSPPARLGASLVYDPPLGSVLLFGGLGPTGFLADTWSFSGGTWTNLTAASGTAPPGRAAGQFVWDAEDSEGVLYGGIGMNGTDWSNLTSGLTSTWLYGSSGWSQVTQVSSGVPSALGAMAYDARDSYVLDFGGSGDAASCTALSTTFDFHQGLWHNLSSSVRGAPSGRWSGAATYDPQTSSVILFGGSDCLSYRNDTWSYASGQWNEISTGSSAPSERSASSLVDDLSGTSLLLYGGIGVNGPQGDTWTFAGSGWVLQGPVLTAIGGILPGSSLLTDSGTVMTIGVEGDLAVGLTSYTYFGLPPGCPVIDAPSFECSATQSGEFALSGIVSSSAGESTLPTVTVMVNTPPTFASVVLSATATEAGVPVTIRTSVQGGTGGYTYQYLGLPQGCQSQDVPVLTCDPTDTGSFSLDVSAVDSIGVQALTTEPLVVGPHPFVQAVGTSRATVDVGLSTDLSVIAGGGVGPLTFSYSGLPGGCTTSNTTGLSCAPSADGTFNVRVTASDAFGFSASGVTPLSVHPRLTATAFSANSTEVYMGDSVSFLLPTSGGTAPYQYSYSGLPTGCPSVNSSSLLCAPRSTGRFEVRVTVTDALGESLTENTTISVAIRPTPIGPGPISSGGPSDSLYLATTAAALVVVAAASVSVGLLVRRNRRYAREGQEIVAQLLDDAPRLGSEFGRFDDPPRAR